MKRKPKKSKKLAPRWARIRNTLPAPPGPYEVQPMRALRLSLPPDQGGGHLSLVQREGGGNPVWLLVMKLSRCEDQVVITESELRALLRLVDRRNDA